MIFFIFMSRVIEEKNPIGVDSFNLQFILYNFHLIILILFVLISMYHFILIIEAMQKIYI